MEPAARLQHPGDGQQRVAVDGRRPSAGRGASTPSSRSTSRTGGVSPDRTRPAISPARVSRPRTTSGSEDGASDSSAVAAVGRPGEPDQAVADGVEAEPAGRRRAGRGGRRASATQRPSGPGVPPRWAKSLGSRTAPLAGDVAAAVPRPRGRLRPRRGQPGATRRSGRGADRSGWTRLPLGPDRRVVADVERARERHGRRPSAPPASRPARSPRRRRRRTRWCSGRPTR